MKKLVMIHTVIPLIESFNKLAKEMLPDVKVFHVLDEPLLEQAKQHGTLDFETSKPDGLVRLQEHADAAEDIGADAVLVTCSTVSPFVGDVHARIPLVKIDEAMMEEAVRQGKRIAVLATNPATLEPTRQSLEAEAARQGKQVEVNLVLVENAFEAFRTGDMATHDRLLKEAVLQQMGQADLIVLAQASMARILEVIPSEQRRTPILTSPHTALQRVKEFLEGERKQK